MGWIRDWFDRWRPRPRPPVEPPRPPKPPPPVAGMLAAVNRARVQAGVAPLREHDVLTLMAVAFAVEMARRGGPPGHVREDGRSSFQVARDLGYPGETNEVTAKGQADAEAAVGAWLQSSGHREVLLAPQWRNCGWAVADGAGGRDGIRPRYWCLDFGE